MRKAAGMAVAVCISASACMGAVIKHDFDDDTPSSGNPIGFNTYGHELADRGITAKTSASGKNSAFIVADFTQNKWGVIFISNMGDWDMTGNTLSANVRASTSFTGQKGVAGFKLVDQDGTGYRTAPEHLFCPSVSWENFSQNVAQLIPDEERGEIPGLDLSHIKQYGIVFYDRDDKEKIVNFYIDDFNVE
jgi:hypothetical protein